MKKKNNKYKALGFVEALIGIMVTGIAATVLMSISANSLRNLMIAETMDKMAQYAKSGAIQAQQISDSEGDADPQDKTIGKLSEGSCYSFTLEGIDTLSPLLGPGAYRTKNIEQDSDYFRVICLQALNDKKAVVSIKTGIINNEGVNTTKSDIKDYEYITIINL